MDWDPIIAIVAIIFGIIVIVWEAFLRWIVGLFLIVLGIWFILQWYQKSSSKGTTAPQQPHAPQSPPPQPPPEQPKT